MVGTVAVPPTLDVSRIARYVESCRVADGGYFFAQIPPAGAQDSYFALAALRLLGRQPQDAPGARRWVEEWRRKPSNVTGTHGVYLLCRLLEELGDSLEAATPYAAAVAREQNTQGGFGAYEDVYVQSPSELRATYEAVSVLAGLGYLLDHKRVGGFVNRFRQPDGGFGVRRSTLASTYYACATLAQMEGQEASLEGTNLYLRRRAERWDVYFLDDVFWLVEGLRLTGGAEVFGPAAATHVLACQRPQGGFARAAAMGIPTLEYTYYALQVLDSVGLGAPR